MTALLLLALLGMSAVPATAGTHRIILVPCGPVSAGVLGYVEAGLKQEFGASMQLGREIPIPAASYNPKRRQYAADDFLPLLEPYRQTGRDLVLGVTAVDLYPTGLDLNFVLGLADYRHQTAIISLARLKPVYHGLIKDSQILKERALKEAVHELGHLLGLGHCSNPACIMFFSNTIADTDRKGPGFCPHCRRQVGEMMR